MIEALVDGGAGAAGDPGPRARGGLLTPRQPPRRRRTSGGAAFWVHGKTRPGALKKQRRRPHMWTERCAVTRRFYRRLSRTAAIRKAGWKPPGRKSTDCSRRGVPPQQAKPPLRQVAGNGGFAGARPRPAAACQKKDFRQAEGGGIAGPPPNLALLKRSVPILPGDR